MASIACPHCSSQIPAQAQFCGVCGARLHMQHGEAHPEEEAPVTISGFLPPGQGMPICPDCGAVAPSKLSSCQVCGTEYGAHPPGAPEVGNEMFWVQVRGEFQCRSCGYFVPLNFLDVDGDVLCIRCGVEQVFDVEAWPTGLTAAHEVGDLGGPNPEGRFPNPSHSIAGSNPYRRIGVDAATATSKQSSTSHRGGAVVHRSLIVTAAPGFPLCDDCHAPLSVRVSGLQATMTCAGCGAEAHYDTPSGGRDLYHNLVAAIAPEHRTDAADAMEHESSEGAALAVRCPNCNGPIAVDGESYFENCGFCHTPVRIREATMRKLVDNPRPLPWWLLFRGPSAKRVALEKHVALAGGASKGKIERPPIVTSKWLERLTGFGIPLAVLLIVGASGLGDRVVGWVDDQVGAVVSAVTTSTTSTPTKRRQVRPSTPTATSTITTVTSGECRCKVGSTRAALVVQGKSSGDGYALAIRVKGITDNGLLLRLDEVTAPPHAIAGDELSLGLACDESLVIIAWQSRVTAWSARDGRARWTTELAGPFRGRNVRAADQLGVRCRQLKIRRGRLRIPVVGKRTARLEVSSGKAK